jgi:endonuclease/exonuclease/phosphatase family metal-dependent hydrolase
MPITLATFNVKDLLDPEDDAGRAHMEQKLAWTAAMIEKTGADVLALQEVGSAAMVNALADRLERRAGYAEPVMGTPDKRGIRCAILSRAPILHAEVHTAASLDFPVFVAGDAPPFEGRIPLRRGVVQVRVDAGSLGAIDVFVAHFKSKRPVPERTILGDEIAPLTAREHAEGDMRSLVQRAAEALHLRGLVDGVLRERPEAHVAVMGDLNDAAWSVPVRIVSGPAFDPALNPLFSCGDAVTPERRFSAIFGGERAQIDHVLVTARLHQSLSSARFLNEELREHEPILDHGPELPPTIDSDHAPFAVTFSVPGAR